MAGVRAGAVRRRELGVWQGRARHGGDRGLRARRGGVAAVKLAADLLAGCASCTPAPPRPRCSTRCSQLSLDLSRLIEAGELQLADIEAIVAELECDALKARAGRLRALIAPVDRRPTSSGSPRCSTATTCRFPRALGKAAAPRGVHRASDVPAASAQADAVAQARRRRRDRRRGVRAARRRTPLRSSSSSRGERGDRPRGRGARPAQRALFRPRASAGPTSGTTSRRSRSASPPGSVRHGRAHRHRLVDQRRLPPQRKGRAPDELRRSARRARPRHGALAELRAAAAYTAARATDFAQDLSDPATLSAVANRLTADDPAKLLSLGP